MGTVEEAQKKTLDSILGKWSKGKRRIKGMIRLAKLLQEIQSRLDFPVSPRGWCYTLENRNIIDKGEFDRAERSINVCRKKGYLPMDFCAEDKKRTWDGVEEPSTRGIAHEFRSLLREVMKADTNYFVPDWWDGEKYYLQMMVEKIDLKSVFLPVCQYYHVPIANAGGWWDLNVLYQMCQRFAAAEKRGLIPVLLYCTDYDSWGVRIAERLKDYLFDIQEGTGYDPTNLTIDRFGLKQEFIEANHLTWIDNLKTGSNKDMTKSYYCYPCRIQHRKGTTRCDNCGKKVYSQPGFVKEWISTVGKRKVEANALVVAPEQGRQLAADAIVEYLGHDAVSRFESKRDKVTEDFETFKQQHPTLFSEIESQLELDDLETERLEQQQEEEEEEEER